MARSDVGTEGQALNAWIREVPMREMAEELDLDGLPMRRENCDFYAVALTILKRMNFVGGQDLYFVAHDVIQKLIFNMSKDRKGIVRKDRKGPLYRYVGWYQKLVDEQGKKPPKFDEYFQWAFRRLALTERGKVLNQSGNKPLSLDYGSHEDENEIGEGLLEDTGALTPEEIYSEKEESEKRRRVFKEIPQLLIDSDSQGWKMEALWKEIQRGGTLQDWADALNAKGIPAMGGGLWGTGSVHKVRNTIYGIVKRHLGKQGIDWHSIVASRARF